MATKPAIKSAPSRTALDVFLGRVEQPMGRLIFVKDGAREFSQFAYSEAWLADAQYFDISPDLSRQAGYQLRKPPTKNDSCFFLALADTAPDAWGRRVIARAHAKARAFDASPGPLTELDYLAAVDDFSRVKCLYGIANPAWPAPFVKSVIEQLEVPNGVVAPIQAWSACLR